MTNKEKWNLIVDRHARLFGELESKVQAEWELYCSDLFDYKRLLNEIDSQRHLTVGSGNAIIPDIDQPEDNVSQPSIKEYLLDCFKTMGENRQVIMVSHNPQFIVNLDVDNIIFVSSSEDGKLRFQSGALEYECNDYSVLKLVENNIDGGLDSIRKRWKWYEKNNRV